MKFQSLAIVFVMIVLPMILVLSYYISLQIDTIALQTAYDNKLIDATNDAITAFELNTANEDLSAVSDQLRTIIMASCNTFINTFSTNIGLSNASKSQIQPYIPAMLYTLYDGYYIYAPTSTPIIYEKTHTDNGVVISDGAATVGDKGISGSGENYTYTHGTETTVNDENYGMLLYKKNGVNCGTEKLEDAEFKTDYVLKSFMPYSATYTSTIGANNVTINYTLDNFISISGTIDGIYYTKSGYYIDPIGSFLIDGINYNLTDLGQDRAKELCENAVNMMVTLPDGTTISYPRVYTGNNEERVQAETKKAITYYIVNSIFSNWVNSNLGFVTGANLIHDYEGWEEDISGNKRIITTGNRDLYYNFSGDTKSIFIPKTDPNYKNPEDIDSEFNNHKYNVIKNAISYNLNLAISSYSSKYSELEFKMPQLTDIEWERITEKVSVVSFVQGLSCGLKNYYGYSVVSSTNNEITVIPDEIYYVPAASFDDESASYHRLDCSNFGDDIYISFKSKEVKYDDVYQGDAVGTYLYDHKNLAAYDCIVENNYLNYDSDSNGTIDSKESVKKFVEQTTTSGNKKVGYYTAVAKERQNLYKTTQYSLNQGLKLQEDFVNFNVGENVQKLEITLQVRAVPPGLIVGNVKINGHDCGKQIVVTNTSTPQTIEVDYDSSYMGTKITTISVDGCPNCDFLSAKVIYK